MQPEPFFHKVLDILSIWQFSGSMPLFTRRILSTSISLDSPPRNKNRILADWTFNWSIWCKQPKGKYTSKWKTIHLIVFHIYYFSLINYNIWWYFFFFTCLFFYFLTLPRCGTVLGSENLCPPLQGRQGA